MYAMSWKSIDRCLLLDRTVVSDSIKNPNGTSSDDRSPEVVRCELAEPTIYKVALAISLWLHEPEDACRLWQAAIAADPELARRVPGDLAESPEPSAVARWLLQLIHDGSLQDPFSKKKLSPTNRESSRSNDTRKLGVYSEAESLDWLRQTCFRAIEMHTQDQRTRESTEAATRRALYNLAYGLSHEINNPLANISARAQWLLGSASTPEAQKNLAVIIEQCTRAHEMLAEVMLAVQPPRLHCKPTDIVSLIADFSRAAKDQAEKRKIQFRSTTPNYPVYCELDAVSIHEALRALFLNSLEACRQGDTIELKLNLASPYEPQNVRIQMIDTGPGMPATSLEQAFDLFFSGREAGRGLGIGLAKVRRIVEGHQGRISLHSQPHCGTTFEISLNSISGPRSSEA